VAAERFFALPPHPEERVHDKSTDIVSQKRIKSFCGAKPTQKVQRIKSFCGAKPTQKVRWTNAEVEV